VTDQKTKAPRPETLRSRTTKLRTGLGSLFVTITEHDGKPFEVFATLGKSGTSTTAKTEAIGRLVSLALRHDIDVQEVIDQLKDIGGDHPIAWADGVIMSIPDAVAKVLQKHYGKKETLK